MLNCKGKTMLYVINTDQGIGYAAYELPELNAATGIEREFLIEEFGNYISPGSIECNGNLFHLIKAEDTVFFGIMSAYGCLNSIRTV